MPDHLKCRNGMYYYYRRLPDLSPLLLEPDGPLCLPVHTRII